MTVLTHAKSVFTLHCIAQISFNWLTTQFHLFCPCRILTSYHCGPPVTSQVPFFSLSLPSLSSRCWRSTPGDWSLFLLSLPNTRAWWRCTVTWPTTDGYKPNWEWQVSLVPLCHLTAVELSQLHPCSPFLTWPTLYLHPLWSPGDLWFIVPCHAPRLQLTWAKLGLGEVLWRWTWKWWCVFFSIPARELPLSVLKRKTIWKDVHWLSLRSNSKKGNACLLRHTWFHPGLESVRERFITRLPWELYCGCLNKN